jgi:N-hydroxyarylamine O-acetyltransferase
MDDAMVVAYLARIGATRSPVLDAAALRYLHRAHLMSVPFENLSIHLDEPVSLADDDLADKIVRKWRGGFCYELNGAFALLLQTLGATVTRLAARVYGDGRLGPPFDHLALAVRLPDGTGPWLADIGFGDHSVYPLALDNSRMQDDPAGQFVIAHSEDGDVDVLRNGQPQYRIEMRERSLADFVPTCWWQATSPQSHFTQRTICSRLTETGRISISGRTLIHTTPTGRTEQELVDESVLLSAYRNHFGITLDHAPRASLAEPGALDGCT